MLQGVFDSSDLAYYLILIATFLILTIRQLDRERLL
jgi:ABC-2 type transport system permease protein